LACLSFDYEPKVGIMKIGFVSMPCSSGQVPKAVVTERNVLTTKILQENLPTIGSCHMPYTLD